MSEKRVKDLVEIQNETTNVIEEYLAKRERIIENAVEKIVGGRFQDWVPDSFRNELHRISRILIFDRGLEFEDLEKYVAAYSICSNPVVHHPHDLKALWHNLLSYENRDLLEYIGQLANALWILSLPAEEALKEIGGKYAERGFKQARSVHNGNNFSLGERNRELTRCYSSLPEGKISKRVRKALEKLEECGYERVSERQAKRILGLERKK